MTREQATTPHSSLKPNPDAELFEMILRVNHQNLSMICSDQLCDDQGELEHRIVFAKVRTVEGFAAKCRVIVDGGLNEDEIDFVPAMFQLAREAERLGITSAPPRLLKKTPKLCYEERAQMASLIAYLLGGGGAEDRAYRRAALIATDDQTAAR
jgi:hypothetical protein